QHNGKKEAQKRVEPQAGDRHSGERHSKTQDENKLLAATVLENSRWNGEQAEHAQSNQWSEEGRRIAQVEFILRQADKWTLGIEKAHGQKSEEYRQRPKLHLLLSRLALFNL